MAIKDEKKAKLLELLNEVSSSDEKSEHLSITKMKELEKELENISTGLASSIEDQAKELAKLKVKIQPIDFGPLLDLLEEIKKGISNIKLQERIDKDYSPAYKMMIDKLSDVNDGVRGWKFPQYAYTGLRNKDFSPINPATDEQLQIINCLIPEKYDYISLSYTGSNLTGVIFKSGGSGGTTISTLVLTYDGSDNLLTVTKT